MVPHGANILKEMGKHEVALVEYPVEQSLEAFLSIHGQKHPIVALSNR